MALTGSSQQQRSVSQKVYVAVMEGRGCPDVLCGFKPRQGDGPYREDQIKQMVIDGVTDDDPMLF